MTAILYVVDNQWGSHIGAEEMVSVCCEPEVAIYQGHKGQGLLLRRELQFLVRKETYHSYITILMWLEPTCRYLGKANFKCSRVGRQLAEAGTTWHTSTSVSRQQKPEQHERGVWEMQRELTIKARLGNLLAFCFFLKDQQPSAAHLKRGDPDSKNVLRWEEGTTMDHRLCSLLLWVTASPPAAGLENNQLTVFIGQSGQLVAISNCLTKDLCILNRFT